MTTEPTSYEDIVYEAEDGIATITINRPQVLNAFREQTFIELTAAFEQADRDPGVGVVVFTGAGNAFCAGADVNFMSEMDPEEVRMWMSKRCVPLGSMIRTLSKPVIAAIPGVCVVGGLELAVFADLRIASHSARIGNIAGMAPVWGVTQLLPSLIGDARARELVFTSRLIEGEEAERWGLVNKSVPAEELQSTTTEWCEQILRAGPRSLRIAKVSLNSATDVLTSSISHGVEMMGLHYQDDEARESLRAFRDRRPADFQQFRQGESG
jgi:enoyl-CoA hydratase/carnithine racemase